LKRAHEATRTQFPATVLDGFHCTADDLAADATTVGGRPVFYQGAFQTAGTLDINPVTWHELAERAVIVRGPLPRVRTDPAQLTAFTRGNLDTYWRGILARIEEVGAGSAGELDEAVAWVVLGAARLHHLLTQGRITSKSGAGRHVVEHLDPRWTPIAQEALRIRERPDSPSQYDDLARRGQDVVELLAWLVEDGTVGRRCPSPRLVRSWDGEALGMSNPEIETGCVCYPGTRSGISVRWPGRVVVLP
jgi:hypothetical protein